MERVPHELRVGLRSRLHTPPNTSALHLGLGAVIAIFPAARPVLVLDAAVQPRAFRASPPQPLGDSTSCVAAFDTLVAIIRRDHPGYRDRVAGREATFAALVDSARRQAAAPAADTSPDVCMPALWRVRDFMRDAHLMMWQGAPPAPPPASAAPGVAPPAPAFPTSAPTPVDPDRPTLRRFDAHTLVLRMPSLDAAYKRVVDSLAAERRADLAAASTFVLDMRGNGGGCTCTYDALLPLVMTGPVHLDGSDVWTSPANVAYYRTMAADPAQPDTVRAELGRLVPRLEAAPNTFVPMSPDPAANVYTPPVIPSRPRAVAVLVDAACASSCENFVRAARQSRKVTVFSATNTAGVGDYTNVRRVVLPGWRQLRIPTARAMWLRAGPRAATDRVGLAPDVRLPADSASGDAAITFALGRVRMRR